MCVFLCKSFSSLIPPATVPSYAAHIRLTLGTNGNIKVKFRSTQGLFFPGRQSNLRILCPEKVCQNQPYWESPQKQEFLTKGAILRRKEMVTQSSDSGFHTSKLLSKKGRAPRRD